MNIINYEDRAEGYLHLITNNSEIANTLAAAGFEVTYNRRIFKVQASHKLPNKRYDEISKRIYRPLINIVIELGDLGYECKGYQHNNDEVRGRTIYSAFIFFSRKLNIKNIKSEETGLEDRFGDMMKEKNKN